MINLIKKSDTHMKSDGFVSKMFCTHPIISLSCAFFIMPIVILLLVFTLSVLIMFPISFLLGWI
ncbi:MAG: hypothetical protein RR497_02225 [Oscillospiraceae bacterium]